jgi:hypothetical protein
MECHLKKKEFWNGHLQFEILVKKAPHIKNDGRKVKTTPIDLIYNLASNPKMKSNSVGFI